MEVTRFRRRNLRVLLEREFLAMWLRQWVENRVCSLLYEDFLLLFLLVAVGSVNFKYGRFVSIGNDINLFTVCSHINDYLFLALNIQALVIVVNSAFR